MEQEKFTTNEDLIAFLCESFPQCFFSGEQLKPLKIGIFRDLADHLKEDERVSNRYLRIALRHYTNSWRYLGAVVEGAQRVDLAGNEIEPVTQQHAEHAAEQLKESKEKAAEKRKQKARLQKPKTKLARKPGEKKSPKVAIRTRKSKIPLSSKIRPLMQDELKSGVKVSVKLGKQPMDATITEVAKDGINVQLNTGMTVKVQVEQLRIATK